MKHALRILSVALLALVASIGVSSAAQAASFNVAPDQNSSATVNSAVNDDAFVVGNTATVSAPVSGEIFAAGATVNLSDFGGRSIFAAGNNVTVSKGTAYDAFVAGSTVTLSGTYGHDVYVAGSTVVISPNTIINGDLRVGGSDVTLGGTVSGSVFASVNKLTFTGGAIAGSLKYQSSKDATGLDKVTIAGSTTRTEPPATSGAGRWDWVSKFLGAFMAILALGAVLMLGKPKTLDAVYTEARGHWGSNFGRGIAFLILVPIVGIILLATGIGWQIAMVLGAAYVAILVLAYAGSAIFLARFLFEQSANKVSPWMYVLLGALAVSLLSALPTVGGLIGFIYFVAVVLPTMGALAKKSTEE